MAQTPFLGSTSYLSVFYDAHPALSRAGSLSLAAEFERWRTDRAYVVRRLTKLISAMAFYEDVIRGYYDRGQFTVIPAPLVLDSLHHARSYLEGSPGKSMLAQEELYAKISENTAKSLRVRPTMRADEFYSLFTGENLRWEFIGFLRAGRDWVLIQYSRNMVLHLSNGEHLNVETFLTEMVLAGYACIEIYKPHGNPNDLMIWLRYTHMLLGTEVLGETSMPPMLAAAS